MIDGIGKASSDSQNVKKAQLTSYDKMVDSDDEQVIYLYWQPHESKP